MDTTTVSRAARRADRRERGVMGLLVSTAETVGIAAGVAVGVSLLTLGIVLLVLRRRRVPPEARVYGILRELDLRMAQLGADLSLELERTREESRRARNLGELGWTIELETVMQRTLDAAMQLEAVDAALVTVADAADLPVTRASGLSDEEVQQLAIERPRSSRIQSMTISYADEPRPSSDLPPVSASIAVPIEARGRTIGVVSVFTRDARAVFADETEQELEDLASRAGPAIENARRFQEARRLAEVDAKTGLHNDRYFDTALAREVAGASRYGRRLALLILDVDDFKQINDRYSRVVGDNVLRHVAERLSSVVRADDVACRMGGAADEFGVILREATASDAQRLYIRLRERLEESPVPGVPPVTVSGGIAGYGGREEPDEFRFRADTALNAAKHAGKGRVELTPQLNGR